MEHEAFLPQKTSRLHWWLAIVFGLLTLVCGTLGLWKYEHLPPASENGPGTCFFIALYHAFQMLILHTPHLEKPTNAWLEVGRWSGALTVIITSAALLWKRLRHEIHLFRLTRWKEHHVICGLGHKGFKIAEKLKATGKQVVVIDPRPDSHLAHEASRQGILILLDDATELTILAQARIAQANEIIVITPTDEINMRIAVQVRKFLINAKAGGVTCHVHLSDTFLREELQKRNDTSPKDTACKFHFFDVFENETRKVLLALPLDGTGISQDDVRAVHVIILGFSRMGRSLALSAAKMGQFANGKPLRLSIIDREAKLRQERFLFRYPGFKHQFAAQLAFYQMEAESKNARDQIEAWSKEQNTLLHIFVCLDDDTRALEVAYRLQNVLHRHLDCRVLARVHSQTSIAPLLGDALVTEQRTAGKSAPQVGEQIIPFGMVEDANCEEVIRHAYNETFAQLIHEHFITQRMASSIRRPENDTTLEAWEKLSEDLRESNRHQADHIEIKLRAIGCRLVPATDEGKTVKQFSRTEVELLARLEHRRWLVERSLAGWQYGTPSFKTRRIHENLVDWESLDDSIREYDRQAVAFIPLLAAQLDPPLKVVRVNQP